MGWTERPAPLTINQLVSVSRRDRRGSRTVEPDLPSLVDFANVFVVAQGAVVLCHLSEGLVWW
jgi:hypothetical protein